VESTKNRIINEAIVMFATDGFDATSMRKIADKVGVSEPAIYRHFNNKNDLGKSIFMDNYTGLAHTISKATDASETSVEAIAKAIHIFYNYYDTKPYLFRYLLTSQHKFLMDDIPDEDNVVTVLTKIICEHLESNGQDQSKATIATALVFGAILQPSVFHLYKRLKGKLVDQTAMTTAACIAALGSI